MSIRRWLRKLTFRKSPPRVAVVRLEGAIAPGVSRFRRGQISLKSLETTLERAFAVPDLAAVALAINSPGGSAVQSSLVAGRIRVLAEEKQVPVIAFVEDVAASGGYWLACAGDEIFADRASLIGSIGVIYSGFGFADLIARHGVERRIHTAGANKGSLDPFQPENPDDVARLKAAQSDIHEGFIEWVRERRGERLSDAADELFSGAFWSAARARELGLIDGLGDMLGVIRERFGTEVRFVQVGRKRSLLRLFSAADLADAAIDSGVNAVEERALWSRFGL